MRCMNSEDMRYLYEVDDFRAHYHDADEFWEHFYAVDDLTS